MLLLGVDGGTTKTIALAAAETGEVLGWARGGGSNWTGEDVTRPMSVVAETARRALRQAGADAADVGVFCLAGADWPEDHTRRQAALEGHRLALRVLVKNDAFGGLRAGTSRPHGIVVAAGTGLNAAAIAPDGREWAFGYYETGGGGQDLAQLAFNAVLRADDGRDPPTLLTDKVLSHLGYPSPEAMLRARVRQEIDPRRFLSLCPCVFEAAREGDATALRLLERQGRKLAEYALALVRRFELQDLEFEVVLAGSVFKGDHPLLVETMKAEILRVAPQARIVPARYEPAVGALLLAFDAAGIPVSGELLGRLEAGSPGPAFYDTRDGAGLAAVD